MQLHIRVLLAVVGLLLASATSPAAVVLYDQDFESPNVPFVDNPAHPDVSGQLVNDLYGNQPSGFLFTQQASVETLHITGGEAWGSGYSDPSGTGGNYALGMLSTLNDDLLGLSFDVGSYSFLNVGIDVSSIDLNCCGGTFVNPGDVPVFRFTLYDNPGGAPGLGSGTVLDFDDVAGTPSAQSVFDWTSAVIALSAAGNTDGNVILRVDLLQGGYAAFDNLRISSSDVPLDLGQVPEPGTVACGCAMAWVAFRRLRHRMDARR